MATLALGLRDFERGNYAKAQNFCPKGPEEKMKNSMEVSQKIAEVIHVVDPKFWVPAVGNGQLGELFLFIEKNNLWEAVQAASREEER